MRSIADNLIEMKMETLAARDNLHHCVRNQEEYAQNCLADVREVLLTLDIVSSEQLDKVMRDGVSLESFLRIAVNRYFND